MVATSHSKVADTSLWAPGIARHLGGSRARYRDTSASRAPSVLLGSSEPPLPAVVRVAA